MVNNFVYSVSDVIGIILIILGVVYSSENIAFLFALFAGIGIYIAARYDEYSDLLKGVVKKGQSK